MPTSNMVDYKWYTYVDDDGNNWSVKLDKEWGADGDSGSTAYTDTDPVLNFKGKVHHPRFITMIDTVTGRTRRLIVCTTAATAWTGANYTKTLPVRGLATEVTFTRVSKTNEKIRRAGAISNKAEVTVA